LDALLAGKRSLSYMSDPKKQPRKNSSNPLNEFINRRHLLQHQQDSSDSIGYSPTSTTVQNESISELPDELSLFEKQESCPQLMHDLALDLSNIHPFLPTSIEFPAIQDTIYHSIEGTVSTLLKDQPSTSCSLRRLAPKDTSESSIQRQPLILTGTKKRRFLNYEQKFNQFLNLRREMTPEKVERSLKVKEELDKLGVSIFDRHLILKYKHVLAKYGTDWFEVVYHLGGVQTHLTEDQYLFVRGRLEQLAAELPETRSPDVLFIIYDILENMGIKVLNLGN
jgi:hypothetical protein